MSGIYVKRQLVSEAGLRRTLGDWWAIERLEVGYCTAACTVEELKVSVQSILGKAADPEKLGVLGVNRS